MCSRYGFTEKSNCSCSGFPPSSLEAVNKVEDKKWHFKLFVTYNYPVLYLWVLLKKVERS